MIKVNYLNIFLIAIFSLFLSGNSYSINAGNSKQLVVVIDPGHGGKDPGAVNKNIREKDVVLGIGLKLGKLISETYPEVKVIYTRNTDVFIPLIDRSGIANKNKADLFISVHANFCSTPSTRGTETFFLGPSRIEENLEIAQKENAVILLEEDYSTTYEGYDPNSPESQIMFEMDQSEYLSQSLSFANAIQQQFKSRSESTNRGVKQAGFLVLRKSSMPSVLIETGFISNQAEANYLSSDEGQQNIAASVFEAFRKFKGKSFGLPVSKSDPLLASIQKNQETNDVSKQVDTIEAKKTETKKEEIILASIETERKEPEKVIKAVKKDTIEKALANEIYYCVQIGANTTPVEPVASNFKGLKNVRRDKVDKYFRYYVGSESSLENIVPFFKQIKLKFPQAFIVSFVDGKRVPVNIGTK